LGAQGGELRRKWRQRKGGDREGQKRGKLASNMEWGGGCWGGAEKEGERSQRAK